MNTKIVAIIFVLFVLAIVLSQVWAMPSYKSYAFMGYDADSSYAADDTVKIFHTVPTGSNRLLVVAVGVNASEFVTRVLWGQGGTRQVMTLAGSRASAAGWMTEIWYLVAPTVGSDTVCIDMAQVHSGGGHGVFNFTNVLQSDPIGAVADSSDGDNATEPVVWLTTLHDSSYVFTACTQHGVNSGPYTPSSGQVEIYDTSGGTFGWDPRSWAGYVERLSSGAQACSLDATGDDPDDDWAIVSIEIRHVPEPGGNIDVAPSPATAAATGVNPTVVIAGPESVSPSAATAAATAVNPNVDGGNIYPAGDNTFYLSPPYARGGNRAGDNGYAGNHPDTAWATLAYAETQMAAGDTLFIMGGLYTNAQTFVRSGTWGTEGSRMVFKAYGDTAAVFSETGGTDRGTRIFFEGTGGPDYVTIDGWGYINSSDSLYLKFLGPVGCGDDDDARQAMMFYGESGDTSYGITITGVEIDGNQPESQECQDVSSGAFDLGGTYTSGGLLRYGIRIQLCDGDTIQSCYIHHIYKPTGNVMPPGDGSDNPDPDGKYSQGVGEGVFIEDAQACVVMNCTFEACAHAAIQVGNTDEECYYCKIVDNHIDCQWGGGIYINTNSGYNLVEGNVITRAGQSTTKTKGAIFLSGSHNTARKNVIWSPLNTEGTDGATDISNHGMGIYGVAAGDHANDNLVYNNTFFDCSPQAILMQSQVGDRGCERNVLANNIILKSSEDYGSGYGGRLVIAQYFTDASDDDNWITPDANCTNPQTTHFGDNTFRYNILQVDTSVTDHAVLVNYMRDSDYRLGCSGDLGGGSIGYSLSDLETVSSVGKFGHESWDSNSEEDPGLVSYDPDADGLFDGWWELAENSVCIDGGVAVVESIGTYVESQRTGYGWDTLTWYGTAPDIGAYETMAGVSVAVSPNYASAAATTVNPTVFADITLSPSSATAAATGVNPTVRATATESVVDPVAPHKRRRQ